MKITLDLDDTLCCFVERWCDWLYINKFTQIPLNLEDVTTYDYFYKKFGESSRQFFLHDPHYIYENVLEPFEGSKEFFDWVSDRFDVQIVTLATKQETIDAKVDFIKKHFNTNNIKFIEKLDEKYTYTKDTILIDDYPKHIINHVKNNNNFGIVFNKNNRNGWSKFENFREEWNDLSIDGKVLVGLAHDYSHVKYYLELEKCNEL